MPMRDNASFCRPRLYDKEDPEREDDVSLVLECLEGVIDEAMEKGDKETVKHATDLETRIRRAAGGDYRDENREGAEVGE